MGLFHIRAHPLALFLEIVRPDGSSTQWSYNSKPAASSGRLCGFFYVFPPWKPTDFSLLTQSVTLVWLSIEVNPNRSKMQRLRKVLDVDFKYCVYVSQSCKDLVTKLWGYYRRWAVPRGPLITRNSQRVQRSSCHLTYASLSLVRFH